jgi:hypothetical protein
MRVGSDAAQRQLNSRRVWAASGGDRAKAIGKIRPAAFPVLQISRLSMVILMV